jgi:hypothetical protein
MPPPANPGSLGLQGPNEAPAPSPQSQAPAPSPQPSDPSQAPPATDPQSSGGGGPVVSGGS